MWHLRSGSQPRFLVRALDPRVGDLGWDLVVVDRAVAIAEHDLVHGEVRNDVGVQELRGDARRRVTTSWKIIVDTNSLVHAIGPERQLLNCRPCQRARSS